MRDNDVEAAVRIFCHEYLGRSRNVLLGADITAAVISRHVQYCGLGLDPGEKVLLVLNRFDGSPFEMFLRKYVGGFTDIVVTDRRIHCRSVGLYLEFFPTKMRTIRKNFGDLKSVDILGSSECGFRGVYLADNIEINGEPAMVGIGDSWWRGDPDALAFLKAFFFFLKGKGILGRSEDRTSEANSSFNFQKNKTNERIQTMQKENNERFCHSCGAIIKEGAMFCPKCGSSQKQVDVPQVQPMLDARSDARGIPQNPSQKALDEKFCSSCGSVIKTAAEICPKCGVRQQSAARGEQASGGDKKFGTALLLLLLPACFCLCGIHRLYTGNIAIGVIQLLTLGGCGIWQLVDFILILSGTYRDGNGDLLSK